MTFDAEYFDSHTYRDGGVMITKGYKNIIRSWTIGVEVEDHAKAQLVNVANLPFIYRHVAVMPDVHAGQGATIGTVIATQGAIAPSAVGVDIGCGLVAAQTTLRRSTLPKDLAPVRAAIEKAIPHGRSDNGGKHDVGSWQGEPPNSVQIAWMELEPRYKKLVEKHPKLSTFSSPENQLGTLGGGNHFCEVCYDKEDQVWIMLHSGSRGVGNRIGTYFIQKARDKMKRYFIELPDSSLAFLPEGEPEFEDYIDSAWWAQRYAQVNRELMLEAAAKALRKSKLVPKFEWANEVVNCHHNYVSRELHFKHKVLVTRKGAISAQKGQLGIIPGSMGAKSYIVRGLGNPDSFMSASHGAGRRMSRTAAKQQFTLKDHRKATEGIECRKDSSVLDETPEAYKNIDQVMEAERDLVEPVHELRQVVCIKG